MINKDKLKFIIPLTNSWNPEPANDEAKNGPRIEVELEAPPRSKFDLQPEGGLLAENDRLNKDSVQWHISYQGNFTAKLTLIKDVISYHVSGNFLDLNLDVGRIKEDNYILLRGSLDFSMKKLNGTDNNEDFKNIWKAFWPTNKFEDIESIQIEPAGVYLRGWLPGPFFATYEKKRLAVLRIPQHMKDWSNSEPLWTLEYFKVGENWGVASDFVKEYAQLFKSFPKNQAVCTTFIRDLVCNPETDCSVKLKGKLPSQHKVAGIYWFASGIGTRIAIGGEETSMSNFYPEKLTGMVGLDPEPYRIGNLEFTYGLPYGDDDVLLKVGPNGANLELEQDLVALSVPMHPLPKSRGPAASRGSEYDQMYRVWLCIRSGWLSIDLANPTATIKDMDFSISPIRESIEIDKLFRSICPGNGEGQSGMQIALQTQGRDEVNGGSFVAISLACSNGDDPCDINNSKLSLRLQRTIARIITPPVWFNASHAEVSSEEIKTLSASKSARVLGDTAKKGVNAQDGITLDPNFIPVLTAGLGKSLKQESDPEEHLKQALREAVFLSKDAFKGIPADLYDDLEGKWMMCKLRYESGEFKIEFNGSHAQVWHRPPGYPLVQSLPLSPASDEGRYLDSNRGLIPYNPVTPDGKVGIIGIKFPEEGLPEWYISENGGVSFENPIKDEVIEIYKSKPYYEIKWRLPITKNLTGITLSYSTDNNNFKVITSINHAANSFFWEPAEKKNMDACWLKIKVKYNAENFIEANRGKFSVKFESTKELKIIIPKPGDKLRGGCNEKIKWVLPDTKIPKSVSLQLILSNDSSIEIVPKENTLNMIDGCEWNPPLRTGDNNCQIKIVAGYNDKSESTAQCNNLTLEYSTTRFCSYPKSLRSLAFRDLQESLPSPFPSSGYPSWTIPDFFSGLRLFLPTLPGIEVTMDSKKDPTWVYRHSVPALDEAYTEVTEKRGEMLTSTFNHRIEDFSRVMDTVAFEVAPNSPENGNPMLISPKGWLHKQVDEGKTIRLNLKDDLKGLFPELELTFPHNTQEQIKFGRNTGQSELTMELKKTVTPINGKILPKFQVDFADGDASSGSLLKIVNNGQPLIVKWWKDANRAVALDGEGLVQAEPIGGRTWSRFNNDQKSEYVHRTVEYDLGDQNQGDALCIDLAGVRSFSEGGRPQDSDNECCTLHDGTGDWPRLRGFPLFPLKLLQFTETDDETTIKLEAIWMPRAPDTLERATLKRPDSASCVIITFHSTGQNPKHLELYGLEGGIDWRFEMDQTDTHDEPKLVRIKAKLEGSERKVGDSISFDLEEIEVDHPLGRLILDNPINANCQIRRDENGSKLKLKILPKNGDQLATVSMIYNIDVDVQPNQEKIELETYSFKWTKLPAKNEAIGWNLTFEPLPLTSDTKSPATQWHFSIFKSPSGRVDPVGHQDLDLLGTLPLEPHRVGIHKYIFQVTGTGADSSKYHVIQSAWLGLKSEIGGIIGVEFEPNDPAFSIKNLAMELQVEFFDEAGSSSLETSPQKTQLVGLLRYDSAKGPRLELTGSLALKNNLQMVETIDRNEDKCHHSIQLFLDHAQVPLEAIYLGKGPDSDQYTSAIVQHVFGFSGGKEWQWQAPQIVRFTSFERYGLKKLIQPKSDQNLTGIDDKSLVLDAGGVFLLEVSQAAKTGGSAINIENDKFRITLLPIIQRSFQVESAHIVRLPVAVWSNPPGEEKIMVSDTGTPDSMIIKSGIQHLLLNPEYVKIVPDNFMAEEEITYFNRTPGASWLDARFLSYSLRPERDERHMPGDNFSSFDKDPQGQVYPADDNGNDPTPKIGQPFKDLSWLKNSEKGDLLAATLARKHQPENGPQVLSGTTIFLFPFKVISQSLSDSGDASSRQVANQKGNHDVQLVGFTEGRFKRLAHHCSINGEDEDMKKWGLNQLQSRRISDSGFILKDYSDIIPLPMSFEAFQEELRYARSWSAESKDSMCLQKEDSNKLSDDQDPSCRLPYSVPKTGPRVRLRADDSLGLFLFDARPIEGKVNAQAKLKFVAATTFKLAPTSVSINGKKEGDYAGCLRPARVSSLLTLTARDEVPFEMQNNSYPKVDPRILQDRPLPKLDAQAETLLPPLIEVVSWAARPGERTRSHWHLNQFTNESSSNNRVSEIVIGSSQHTSVDLRRPRSKAGSNESVSLQQIGETKTLMDKRFYHASFVLTQLLDKTPIPTNGIDLVLVTRKELFKNISAFSKNDLDIAKRNPARIYFEKKPNDKIGSDNAIVIKDIEDLDLYLIIVNEEIQTNSIKVLLWTTEPTTGQTTLPDLIDGDLVKSDGKSGLIIRNLSALSSSKESIPGCIKTSDTTHILSVDCIMDGKFEEIIKQALLVSPGRSLFLTVAVYKLDLESENPNKYSPIESKSIFINLLPWDGTIIAPKMSISLLAYTENEANKDSKDCILAGYGRLGNKDFSLIKPSIEGNNILWMRAADLQILDRKGEGVTSPDTTKFDFVVYGEGGELIPKRSP